MEFLILIESDVPPTMKAIVYFQVMPRDVPREAYDELCQEFPQWKGEHGYSCKLPIDNADLHRMVSLLEAHGVLRHRSCMKGRFKYRIDREYDESDFDASQFLRLSPIEWVYVGNEGRNPKGLAIIDPMELEKDARCSFQAGFTEETYFVLESIKSTLKRGNLAGLTFQETEWNDPIRHFKRERIWEMSSEVVLPKMANIANLVHAKSEPFSGDYSRPVYIREEPFARGGGEIHYKRSDLDGFGPFDLARTFEFHLGRRHSLIASQRLFQYCRDQQLPFTWRPVRIDPD